MTDDGKPLFAARHPVAPWYKRLWYSRLIVRLWFKRLPCRLFGIRFNNQLIEVADGQIWPMFDECTRCHVREGAGFYRVLRGVKHD